MDVSQLPYVDEHVIHIDARPERVWPALLDTVDRSFSGAGAGRYARAVGCVDRTAAGPRPLTEGSTIPGFRVATAVPESELVLVGRHRYSSYALSFQLEPATPEQTRLRAVTRAAFPGVGGGAYRLLVLGTRGHVFLLRRLLSAVRGRSES